MVNPISVSDGDEPCEDALHHFVRQRRMRLAPDSRSLGAQPRLPARIGKPVTQEELAEHLGISRQWYARFERGAPAAFSTLILNRLADLLLLSPAERAKLVRLAIPELAPVVSSDSTNVYDALRNVRKTVRRLWNATSETEIVQVACEEARAMLPNFEVIFARRIIVPEETMLARPGATLAARLAEARAEALREFTADQLVKLDDSWKRIPAGALLPFEAYPSDNLQRFCLALQARHIRWRLPVAAHIRGPKGSAIVGGTSTHPHDASDLERVVLSTIAEFASMALQ